MKFFIILYVITLAIAVTKTEEIMKEEHAKMLQDNKRFHQLYNCLMDPNFTCPDRLKVFQRVLPGYLRTNCGSCSLREKTLFDKHDKIVKDLYPIEYKNVLEKFGPKK